MASQWMCIYAACTRCWHGHSISQLAWNTLDLQQASKTFQPLWWQSSGNPSHYLWLQIYFKGCVFQKLLGRAFTVIVTWPQARATEVCSTAHLHTQSQYIHPLAHSVSPKPSAPWLALTVYSSSQDALRASRLCIGEREVVCYILLLRIMISVTQKPWRSYPGEDTFFPQMLECWKFYHLFCSFCNNFLRKKYTYVVKMWTSTETQ